MTSWVPRAVRAICLSVLLLLVAAHTAAADELRLVNGDRYTGRVVTLEAGTVRFDTGRGTLELPWRDVTVLLVDTPITVTTIDIGPVTVLRLELADGTLNLGDVESAPQNDVIRMVRPLGRPTMTGGLNVGMFTTSGNSRVNSLRVDGEYIVRARQNRYTVNGVLNRANDGTNETARNASGGVRLDQFLRPRLYTNGNALFTHDRFRDLSLRTAAGLGLGWQAKETRRMRLQLEGGYGYVSENFRVGQDSRFHAAREAVTMDLYFVGRRVTFYHRHDAYVGFAGGGDVFIQTRNGGRIGLVGRLVMTVQYDVDYDASPSPGLRETDHIAGVTFGYRF